MEQEHSLNRWVNRAHAGLFNMRAPDVLAADEGTPVPAGTAVAIIASKRKCAQHTGEYHYGD